MGPDEEHPVTSVYSSLLKTESLWTPSEPRSWAIQQLNFEYCKQQAALESAARNLKILRSSAICLWRTT